MRTFIFLAAALFPGTIIMLSCTPAPTDESRLQDFITAHLAKLVPKVTEMNVAQWNANATGDKKYYDEAAALELSINQLRANRDDFALLKGLKEAGTIRDSLLRRELTLLYNAYLKNQIDTALLRAMVEKQSEIANTFNTFRGSIDGQEVSDNDISAILKSESNAGKRKKAWEAGKQVGRAVAPMIVELVKLRNRAAKQLGFENYYVLSLAADEQDPAEILAVFDSLDQLTGGPFSRMKTILDRRMTARFGIKEQQLRPWHYEDPFFQEAPSAPGVDLDALYRGKNLEELGKAFYAGIGLPVEDILRRSDLYPRKGKYQHAFENDMDRSGDIRVMLNMTDNEQWMATLLHELGHGVYSKEIDRSLPYLLRVESHTFLTEAIAQLMERQASNPDWLQAMLGISDGQREAVRRGQRDFMRAKELIFSRWSQVMMRFERALYENPDRDLNALWWDLVEQYQLIRRPENRSEPDWAAKIHLAQYPCYYHNYMLGELAASQFLNAITRQALKQDALSEISFAGKPAVGEALKTRIFRPGARLGWNDLLKYATGEGLTPKYFVEEFVSEGVSPE